jgi:hypothetical protein
MSNSTTAFFALTHSSFAASSSAIPEIVSQTRPGLSTPGIEMFYSGGCASSRPIWVASAKKLLLPQPLRQSTQCEA